MARKKYYIGSRGPFFYNDDSTFKDGENHVALRTEAQIIVGEPPTEEGHVVRVGDLTFPELKDIVITKHAPTSIDVNASDGETGDVSDIAIFGDGNYYQVEEASGATAFDFEIVWTDITAIVFIGLQFYYNGSSGHEVVANLWNKTTSSWIEFFHIPDASSFNYRFADFPMDQDDYIDNGTVKMQIKHIDSGIATHWIRIGYAAILN